MRTDTLDGSDAIASSSAALDTLPPDEPVSAPVFDIAPPAAPRHGRQRSLSRLESRHAQRRRRRLAYLRRLAFQAAAWRDWMVDVCASVGRRVSGRLPVTRPPSETPLEHQESKGFVVALLLALTAVGYGGFVGVSWRERAQPGVLIAGSAGAEAAAATPAVETVLTRRVVFTPSAETLTATWQRRETRSLEQALNALLRETPAFHRCGIGVIETDRAVATCQGVAASGAGVAGLRPATWNLEFRRTGGRWLIARVAMR